MKKKKIEKGEGMLGMWFLLFQEKKTRRERLIQLLVDVFLFDNVKHASFLSLQFFANVKKKTKLRRQKKIENEIHSYAENYALTDVNQTSFRNRSTEKQKKKHLIDSGRRLIHS